MQREDPSSNSSLSGFAPGKHLTMIVKHSDGSSDNIEVEHTYNDTQIAWFKAGSALNYARLNK